jgi:hypothetical protein
VPLKIGPEIRLFSGGLPWGRPEAPLVACQRIRKDLPDVVRRLGKKEIQDHREVAPDPARDCLRFPGEEFPDVDEVHETSGYDEHEAYPVLPSPARSSRHLV